MICNPKPWPSPFWLASSQPRDPNWWLEELANTRTLSGAYWIIGAKYATLKEIQMTSPPILYTRHQYSNLESSFSKST
ncbi:hypothetical protein RJZ57_000906, partial [Blastomyces gilchristii]